MKLYVWENVHDSYIDGKTFALAESREQAIEVILNVAKDMWYVSITDQIKQRLEDYDPEVFSSAVGFFNAYDYN
jgi:hypothetical protein